MGFGRNSHVGWVQETTWGTLITPPTKFAEMVSEAVKSIRKREARPVVNNIDDPDDSMYDALFKTEGEFTIELSYIGLLRLWEHLFGDGQSAGASQDTGARFIYTLVPKDWPVSGKGLTLYVRNDVDPERQYPGCKITGVTISITPDKRVLATFRVVGKGDVNVVSANTPTFPAYAQLAGGNQTVVKIDTVARDCESVEIIYNNSVDGERRGVGAKTILEPIQGSDRRMVSGTLTLAVAAGADLTKYTAGTLFRLDVEMTGAVLGTANWNTNLSFLKCLITDDPYHVENAGVVKSVIPFKALKPVGGAVVTVVINTSESTIA